MAWLVDICSDGRIRDPSSELEVYTWLRGENAIVDSCLAEYGGYVVSFGSRVWLVIWNKFRSEVEQFLGCRDV